MKVSKADTKESVVEIWTFFLTGRTACFQRTNYTMKAILIVSHSHHTALLSEPPKHSWRLNITTAVTDIICFSSFHQSFKYKHTPDHHYQLHESINREKAKIDILFINVIWCPDLEWSQACSAKQSQTEGNKQS